jgi:methylaspartate ammonia-lyase
VRARGLSARPARGVRIRDVLAVPAGGAFFFDDQAAIRRGAPRDGFAYAAGVRRPAEAVSVLLVLEDGHVAHGDCVSVQYSGAGGREPGLEADRLAAQLRADLAPSLRGRELTGYDPRALDGLGAAAAYGVSQALLDACAHRAGLTIAEYIRAEWGLAHPLTRLPVFAQTGEDRRANVEKMILKRVDSLPHGLINAPELVGPGGEALVSYVRWVRERIEALRPDPGYDPILHFDTYGLLRAEAEPIILAMEAAAGPLRLRVEHPLDAGSRDAQAATLARLRARLRERGARAQVVADEWANTVDDIRAFNRAGAADVIQIKTPDLGGVHHVVDAVLDCRAHGVVAHIGGSCTETERAAQVSVHLAMGAGADQLLAKPGMGVDEGLSIVRNEMERTLALSHQGGDQ